MSDAAPLLDDEAMLARLAACDLAAAERVHAKLMAAEEASEIAELGRTYQRLSRSLRQTLALKAKLKRDREQEAKDAPPPKVGGQAVAARIRDLREGLMRVAWDEAEDAEAFDWEVEELDAVITAEMLKPGFGAEPLDDHVARVCFDLGYAPATIARWRDLPDPPRSSHDDPPSEAPEPDPSWRSSA